MSPPDLSLLMRSTGKSRFKISDDDFSLLLQTIHSMKEEFTLMELVDVLWGMVRLNRVPSSLWKSSSKSTNNEYMNDLYQYTEEFITNHTDAMNVLRP